jgi:hypothetical protein
MSKIYIDLKKKKVANFEDLDFLFGIDMPLQSLFGLTFFFLFEYNIFFQNKFIFLFQQLNNKEKQRSD